MSWVGRIRESDYVDIIGCEEIPDQEQYCEQQRYRSDQARSQLHVSYASMPPFAVKLVLYM
jgi:hypothetical protein